jgi:hypothetical protein
MTALQRWCILCFCINCTMSAVLFAAAVHQQGYLAVVTTAQGYLLGKGPISLLTQQALIVVWLHVLVPVPGWRWHNPSGAAWVS